MGDAVVELAYDAAVAALREQDLTVTSLRNRATGLLAAAAVSTSFASGVGLVTVEPGRGAVLPGWAGWTLFALLGVVGGCVLFVLWPVSGWRFGLNPGRLLRSAGEPVDDVRAAATRALVHAIEANETVIRRWGLAYRLGAGTLLVQMLVLVLALMLSRGGA